MENYTEKPEVSVCHISNSELQVVTAINKNIDTDIDTTINTKLHLFMVKI